MKKTCIIGASGYTGAELIKLLVNHPAIDLAACYVSDGSQYAELQVGQVHAELSYVCDLTMQALPSNEIAALKDQFDFIFLATPHEFSHDYLPLMLGGKAKVLDLSGAYRLQDTAIFEAFYGFKHLHKTTLSNAVYGLAEWYADDIQDAPYIAVAGCYPTASLLALKPLLTSNLLDTSHMPVINATSGVSGAGKKASMTSSFYEVSLQAYGVLSHRHTPEIEAYAGTEVIFTPHLGAFKRGILANLTAFVKPGVTLKQIENAYFEAYNNRPMVRVKNSMPKVDDVAHTPFCDIGFAFDAKKHCVVVTSAIDNLLKGASAQAVQCCNIMMGLDEQTALVNGKRTA